MDIKQYILNNRLLKKSKGNKKISRNKWQWKHNNTKPMRFSKSSAKREFYSRTILPQETRKHQIDNLTLHLKQLKKEEQTALPPKLVKERNRAEKKKKEIVKSQAEINEK